MLVSAVGARGRQLGLVVAVRVSWKLWALRELRLTWDNDLNVGQVVSDHFLEGSLHLVGQNVERAFRIVGLAVVPYQLQVIEHFLYGAVLPRLQLVLHSQQVHGVFHDERVVIEFEF